MNPKDQSHQKPAVPYDPLNSEAVDKKSYSNPGYNFTSQQLATDIPEPMQQTAAIIEPEIPGTPDFGGGSSGGGNGGSESSPKKEKEPKEPKSFNPDLEDLSESEKEKKARQMAEYLLNLYAAGKIKANDLVKISQRKINKLANSGEIDLQLMVQVDAETQFTLGEFLSMYNNKCDGLFVMTEEFREMVLPPLTRVLMKHGHGMTDEQLLIFLFGQDILTMVIEGFATRRVLKDTLQFAKDHSAAYSKKPSGPMPAQPAPPYNQPATAPASTSQVIEQMQEPQQQSMTLQEQALASKHFIPGSERQEQATTLTKQTMRRLNKVVIDGQKAEDRANKNADKLYRKAKKNNAAVVSNVPTGGRKKPGPKPGSKRKPKL